MTAPKLMTSPISTNGIGTTVLLSAKTTDAAVRKCRKKSAPVSTATDIAVIKLRHDQEQRAMIGLLTRAILAPLTISMVL